MAIPTKYAATGHAVMVLRETTEFAQRAGDATHQALARFTAAVRATARLADIHTERTL